MKARDKIILSVTIGIVFIGLTAFLFLPNEQQSRCEKMGGTWNGDSCLITQETFDSGQVTCDPGPIMENRSCRTNGMRIVMIEPSSPIEKLLLEKNIEYASDTLAVSRQITFAAGDPGCGAVMDMDNATHWFGIDSVSEPKEMKVFSENPNPCRPNTASCFCSVQTLLAENTITELTYFDPVQEEHIADIVHKYIEGGNYNITPKFLIGKYNMGYAEEGTIGFCGEFWGHSKRDYFLGWIEDGKVTGFGVKKELPKLCAINDDAKYYGKVLGEQ